MNGYIKQVFQEFEHIFPKKIYASPFPYGQPNYKKSIQYAPIDTSPMLLPNAIKFIQCVTGKFLFYAQVIDNTMLHVLNNIASATINGTETPLQATKDFLNYAACNSNVEII